MTEGWDSGTGRLMRGLSPDTRKSTSTSKKYPSEAQRMEYSVENVVTKAAKRTTEREVIGAHCPPLKRRLRRTTIIGRYIVRNQLKLTWNGRQLPSLCLMQRRPGAVLRKLFTQTYNGHVWGSGDNTYGGYSTAITVDEHFVRWRCLTTWILSRAC
jgi:hypothetical protein